jgi:hypothetical protein
MTLKVNDRSVATALNREAIRDVIARYCRAVDRCDAELLRTCYHLDGHDRHGRFAGSVSEFVDWVIGVLQTTSLATQHAVSTIYIELDDETAWVESTFTAMHVRHDAERAPTFMDTFWGRYVDRFECRDGSWAIASREVVYDWSERRPYASQMEYLDTYRQGRRDRLDVSYERGPGLNGRAEE